MSRLQLLARGKWPFVSPHRKLLWPKIPSPGLACWEEGHHCWQKKIFFIRMRALVLTSDTIDILCLRYSNVCTKIFFFLKSVTLSLRPLKIFPFGPRVFSTFDQNFDFKIRREHPKNFLWARTYKSEDVRSLFWVMQMIDDPFGKKYFGTQRVIWIRTLKIIFPQRNLNELLCIS